MKTYKPSLPGLLLAALLITASPALSQLPDWVTMKDFATKYANKATGSDLVDQSRVAWMLFARVNQPKPYQTMQITRWEDWPSDMDTFPPSNGTSFLKTGKVRPVPHLQISKTGVHSLPRHPNKNVTQSVGTDSSGEEVTRNQLSYDYIMSNTLNTKEGVAAFLQRGSMAQFPIGTVEIKAIWDTKNPNTSADTKNSAYSFIGTSEDKKTTYYLTALHIMAKFVPTPADPFTSPAPSWFWTTFEYKGNPGLDHAKTFLLPTKDNLNPAEAQQLLADSGVLKTFPNLANYVCNGTQISFVYAEGKAKGKPVLLGNTKLETFGFEPRTPKTSYPKDPLNAETAKWKIWKISCHTCHGEASAKLNNGLAVFQPFIDDEFKESAANVGKIDPCVVKGYTALDFNWAIALQLNLPPPSPPKDSK